MSKLLVRLKDNLRSGHPHPGLAYRPGDIVFIGEDNHIFGSKEGLPNFTIINVSSIPPGQIKKWERSETEDVVGPEGTEQHPKTRREFKINTDAMNPTELLDYNSNSLSLSKQRLLQIVYSKPNNQSESAAGVELHELDTSSSSSTEALTTSSSSPSSFEFSSFTSSSKSSDSSTESTSSSESSNSSSDSSSISGESVSSASSSSSLENSLFSSSSSSSVNAVQILWDNIINCDVKVINELTKTGGGNWLAGAQSNQILSSGSGYVEWSVSDILNASNAVGLANNSNPDDAGRDSFNFGLVQNNKNFIVRELGTNVFSANNDVLVGDVFRIQINADGTVKYYKNGVFMFVSTKTIVYPVKVDTSIRETGNKLTDVMLHGNWL